MGPITTGFTGTNHTTVLFTQQVRANQERSSAPSYMKKYLPEFLSAGGGWSGKHYKLIGLGLQDGALIKDANKQAIGKKGSLRNISTGVYKSLDEYATAVSKTRSRTESQNKQVIRG